MSDPSIVLGIVTHNRADILPKAMTSALAQSAKNLRVVVVNDGSSDKTVQVRDRFPGVHWIEWPRNKGLIAARNFLMKSADEDYFVSLDDDAWFQRGDEVSVALRHLINNPTVAAVAFDVLSPDRTNPVERMPAKVVSMFIGCGHMIRLSSAREVGFYEEPPGLYGGEEKDLCLRLMDAGYRIDLLPGVHVWHDKSGTARSIPEQHRSGVCNDLVMTLRRAPAMMLPVALLVKVSRHAWFSMRNGLLKPCFEGIRLFICSIPSIWRSRRPVKASTLRAFMSLR